MSEELDPVREHSLKRVTRRLDHERDERLVAAVEASPSDIADRLRRLDKEWDIERVLEANAATLSLVALLAVLRKPTRRRVAVAGIVPAFLLQHAVSGWCPPIELFRVLGRRSRNEIDAERTALKVLRGDFTHVAADAGSTSSRNEKAAAALEAAGRR